YKGALALYTASSTEPAERMRIDNLGNVGIGATSPITQLHVPGRVPTTHLATISTGVSSGVDDIALQGRYAYLADTDGSRLLVYDVSNPESPTSVTSTPTGATPRDLSVQGRYVYLANQGANQLQIFDISNPKAPSSIATTTATSARAVSVQGRYAYVVQLSTANVLQTFDISNPTQPVSVGSRTTGTDPRAIVVQGRYAYIATGTAENSFQVFDVSNPLATSGADGNVANTGFDTLDVAVQGRYAYITLANEGATTYAFKIYDISNPTSPSAGRYADVTIGGANGALQIFDVSNPASPTLVGSITQSGMNGFRGIFVQGRYVYISLPIASELRIFDIGGGYIQQLETGGLEVASANVRTNLTVNNGLTISGGINVGMGGIYSAGSLALATSHANAISISPFGTSAGNTGEMRFLELSANGSNYAGFKSPDSIAANIIWTLPNADGTNGQLLSTNGSGTLSWATSTSGNIGFFGDGTDGPQTLNVDGNGTYTMAALSFDNPTDTYTLTRDLYCTTLTINASVTVKSVGYRIFCKTSVTNSGTISANGNDASGATAGGQTPQATVNGGVAGGNGATGACVAGTSISVSLGGSGGAGGAGTAAAGGAGTSTAPAANLGGFRHAPAALHMWLLNTTSTPVRIGGGSGGGGGGGDNTSINGGGGGGGGGIIIVVSPTITNSGTISAIGGNGANGTGANSGGGGGGGGGVLVLISNTAVSGTKAVTGGIKGTGTGGGGDGSNGATGTIIEIIN
ncbi:beta-propeller fold lactonase family protein, partial [Candidatus Uhrbacteria bacterium]|nr:beta-propeller fold lactonase family protein [Candidatus Uhrbacteria bacterium]